MHHLHAEVLSQHSTGNAFCPCVVEPGAPGVSSAVFTCSAVLEVMAPVRVATRGGHIEGGQESHAVASTRSGRVVVAVRTVSNTQLAVEVLIELVGRENTRVPEGELVIEQAVGDVHVRGTFHYLVAEDGGELTDFEVPTVTHRGAELNISLFEEQVVRILLQYCFVGAVKRFESRDSPSTWRLHRSSHQRGIQLELCSQRSSPFREQFSPHTG